MSALLAFVAILLAGYLLCRWDEEQPPPRDPYRMDRLRNGEPLDPDS